MMQPMLLSASSDGHHKILSLNNIPAWSLERWTTEEEAGGGGCKSLRAGCYLYTSIHHTEFVWCRTTILKWSLMPNSSHSQQVMGQMQNKSSFFLPHAFETHTSPYAGRSDTVFLRRKLALYNLWLGRACRGGNRDGCSTTCMLCWGCIFHPRSDTTRIIWYSRRLLARARRQHNRLRNGRRLGRLLNRSSILLLWSCSRPFRAREAWYCWMAY